MKFSKAASVIIYSFLMQSIKSQENDSIESVDFVPSTIVSFEELPSTRIVGGANAAEGQFPYQVSLRESGSHICGGSIISESYVVTAAHCVTTELRRAKSGRGRGRGRGSSRTDLFSITPASQLSIRAGSVLRNSGGVVVGVARVIPHPNYGNFVNDIALLKLASPLNFTERIKAIPLGNTELVSGSAVVVSGWGDLRAGGFLPVRLQYNTLSALSNEECRRQVGHIPQSILCLAHRSGNGVCQGDSGGPAIQNGRLVGVADYVIDSCGSSAPDGFAKVSHFYKWLRENTDL